MSSGKIGWLDKTKSNSFIVKMENMNIERLKAFVVWNCNEGQSLKVKGQC